LTLPEELEWDDQAEDVALSLDAIKRCLSNMLTALDRDTPQTKDGLVPHSLPMQEPTTFQEPPWLWFTLPELGFPLLTDEYRRPKHPEIEEYMRRYVSYDQDWEQVDDEDCWGINYTEPTAQIRGKIETILHIWGEEQPEKEQDELTKLTPEIDRFSELHAARDPKILKDRNLENEDIFELIKNPPEVGTVRIFELLLLINIFHIMCICTYIYISLQVYMYTLGEGKEEEGRLIERGSGGKGGGGGRDGKIAFFNAGKEIRK